MTVLPGSNLVGGADEPFAALTRELTDLDLPGRDPGDGVVTHAAVDEKEGRGTVLAVVDRAHTRTARLTAIAATGVHEWTVAFSADTPSAIQLLVLYLVLHSDQGDEAAVLRSVADALSVDIQRPA